MRKAEFNGMGGKAGVVLFAGKAFFLGIIGLIILGVAVSWQTLIGFTRGWGLLD